VVYSPKSSLPGLVPRQHAHSGVVAGDSTDPATPDGPGTAEQNPLVCGPYAPTPDQLRVRRVRPGQVAVEDVPGRQAQFAFQVQRGLRLDARHAVLVPPQAVLDR